MAAKVAEDRMDRPEAKRPEDESLRSDGFWQENATGMDAVDLAMMFAVSPPVADCCLLSNRRANPLCIPVAKMHGTTRKRAAR